MIISLNISPHSCEMYLSDNYM